MIKINKEKLNIEKVKQVSLIVLACSLFCFGFMNYKSNIKEDDSQIAIVENENEDMLGDVELVSSGAVVENETLDETINQSDYFDNVRIERDSMYSSMLDTYNKMIDNKNLAETQKAIAAEEIKKITNNQNAIMIAENLIKNKGFEDAVVLANSDVINVIVKASILNNDDISKIQNIIEREFKVSLENVNISNKI